MQITPLFTAPATTATAGQDGRSTEIAGDFDQFLQLLTTQLQNQDPTAPMDATEFTNQLVAFSEVEQLVKQSGQMDSLIQLQEIGQASGAASLVGRQVDLLDDRLAREPDGSADAFYILDEAASDTLVTVLDAQGRQVRRLTDMPGAAGLNRMTWDGLDDNGSVAPDNQTYRLQVIPRDASGTLIGVNIGSSAAVTGVFGTDTGTGLSLADNRTSRLDAVLGVAAP